MVRSAKVGITIRDTIEGGGNICALNWVFNFLKFRFGVLVGLKLYVRADEINLIFVK